MTGEILFDVTAYLMIAGLVFSFLEDSFATFTDDERVALRLGASILWPALLVGIGCVRLVQAAVVLARGTRSLAGRGLRRVRGRDRVGMPRARVMRRGSVTGVRS